MWRREKLGQGNVRSTTSLTPRCFADLPSLGSIPAVAKFRGKVDSSPDCGTTGVLLGPKCGELRGASLIGRRRCRGSAPRGRKTPVSPFRGSGLPETTRDAQLKSDSAGSLVSSLPVRRHPARCCALSRYGDRPPEVIF